MLDCHESTRSYQAVKKHENNYYFLIFYFPEENVAAKNEKSVDMIRERLKASTHQNRDKFCAVSTAVSNIPLGNKIARKVVLSALQKGNADFLQ